MEYRGTFENGMIRPDEPVALPEGTAVEFQPVSRERPGFADELQGEQRFGRFHDNLTVDELARRQGVTGPVEWSRFGGIWPENESIDEFLEMVRRGRR